MLSMTFAEYYKKLTEYVLFHEVTDLEGYDLPRDAVIDFYERQLTLEQAAYEIATEGI